MTAPASLVRRSRPELASPVLAPDARDDAPAAARPSRARGGAWRALLLVLAFWWGATGLLIALQRSAGSRAAALALAAAAGAGGYWLLARARARQDERGAVQSFLGGALLWTCVQGAFYGGWVVGLGPQAPTDAPVLVRAVDAILATSYSALLTAALLAGAVALTRGAPNRLGLTTFLAFWAVHELAKLNVFLGVVNPGAQYLPDYLAHLQRYFGPARNSALLPLSVVALLAWTGWLVRDAVRARVPGHRVGAHRVARALLAMVVLLAAFEHALLGTPRQLGWWDAFLALRGAPGGAP
jgi:putative photosynthetic complex assembly protein 2